MCMNKGVERIRIFCFVKIPAIAIFLLFVCKEHYVFSLSTGAKKMCIK